MGQHICSTARKPTVPVTGAGRAPSDSQHLHPIAIGLRSNKPSVISLVPLVGLELNRPGILRRLPE
jgi:hypothetical protein